jgi:putative endonuclease
VSKISDGKFGERAACIYLSTKGYEVLERNWHCRYGEIDIVARKNNRLVFVEVKMRSQSDVMEFQDLVGASKLGKLRSSIDMYLYSKQLCTAEWRLDGVYVIRDPEKLHFRHFQGLLED